MKKRRHATLYKGLLAIVIASACYGLQPITLNLLMNQGANGNTAMSVGFWMNTLLLAALLLVRRRSLRVSLRQFCFLLLCGLSGFYVCEFLRVLAYETIDVSVALLFHFCFPAIVTLTMITVFREKPTPLKLLSIALALGGIVLMTDFSNGVSLKGAIFALLSGVAYGIYIIGNDRSCVRELPTMVTVFYVCLIAAVCFTGQNLLLGDALLPEKPVWYLQIFLQASLCGAVPIFFFAQSIRYLGASTTTILNNIEPLVGIVGSLIIFREPVSVKLIFSCIFILLSSVLVALDAARQERTIGGNQ